MRLQGSPSLQNSEHMIKIHLWFSITFLLFWKLGSPAEMSVGLPASLLPEGQHALGGRSPAPHPPLATVLSWGLRCYYSPSPPIYGDPNSHIGVWEMLLYKISLHFCMKYIPDSHKISLSD